MKTFETLLQNACEDYFTSLDHEPTLEEVEKVCRTHVSSVVWRALRHARGGNKPITVQEERINNVPLSRVKEFLSHACGSLINQRVGDKINAINYLFELCPKYGYKFSYGVGDGLNDCLNHTADDNQLIVSAGFSKIKNN